MKTLTHHYISSLIAAAALIHPVAKADQSLWREQIPVPASVLLTLAPSTDAAPASDGWLWREQVLASGAASLYVAALTEAGPSAHALWREQLSRDTRRSTPSVAQSADSPDD